MTNLKYFEVQKPTWQKSLIIPTLQENISNYTWNNESEEWQESQKGEFTGFAVWNGKQWELYINHEMDCDYFHEVKFEILETEVNYYGTGKDRVTAKLDNDDPCYYESSNWQGNLGYTLHYDLED